MAINPLPQATIHLLGSSQTLTTPLSLVKELLDNSLDAQATSVDVLISLNTLDKVEVRDNGHGITQEDFDALGRRGHTSKLRSFDELKCIGGISLGFRGEALASAVQLGEVSVTTKTEGEAVATCVILKAPGGILKQTRTSHPVGTTICVKNFISRIPVRKQTALKAAPKTLVKIKELLQAYALARPTVKLGLKILKESKGGWSFVPRLSEGVRGAVSQVIGKDAAAECIEKTLTFAERETGRSAAELGSSSQETNFKDPELMRKADQFVVEIFLPKANADPAKIGYGQYMSVDSRPVANDKGTMRKIVTLFKSYIKGSLGDGTESIKNPFLRMNLKCPVESYDPNVEPAKDDVLFGNEDWLLESIESFFKELYGDIEKTPAINSKQAFSKKMDDFELLLSRKAPAQSEKNSANTPAYSPQASLSPKKSTSDFLPTPSKAVPLAVDHERLSPDNGDDMLNAHRSARRNRWGVDMSTELSEEEEEEGDLQSDQKSQTRDGVQSSRQSDEDGTSDANGLNPWVIAKLTAPVRPKIDMVTNLPPAPVESQNPVFSFPATPRRSSDPSLPSFGYRIPDVLSTHRRRTSFTDLLIPQPSHDHPPFQEPLQVDSPALDCRAFESPARHQEDPSEDELHLGEDAQTFTRRNDFISARNVTEENTPPTVPESMKLPRPKRQGGLNQAFRSPLLNVDNPVPRDNLRQTKLYLPPMARQIERREEEHPDLEWAMDFENRKEELTRQRRQKIKASRAAAIAAEADPEVDVVRTSPHKNRYNAAIAVLSQPLPLKLPQDSDSNIQQPIKTTIPDGDPRAYLVKRQKRALSNKPIKPLRLTSGRLPLERVPEGAHLHELMLTIPTSVEDIETLTVEFGKEDKYIKTGELEVGSMMLTAGEMTALIRRTEQVAEKWKEKKTEGDMVFEFDFGELMRVVGKEGGVEI